MEVAAGTRFRRTKNRSMPVRSSAHNNRKAWFWSGISWLQDCLKATEQSVAGTASRKEIECDLHMFSGRLPYRGHYRAKIFFYTLVIFPSEPSSAIVVDKIVGPLRIFGHSPEHVQCLLRRIF